MDCPRSHLRGRAPTKTVRANTVLMTFGRRIAPVHQIAGAVSIAELLGKPESHPD
jgi:hypothetical protein